MLKSTDIPAINVMKTKFDRFTIIIPTHNRIEDLKNILNYYNDQAKGCQIIIADSSKKHIKKTNQKNLKKFKNIKILYLKYPVDTKPYYYYKIYDAIKHVKSEYCVLCGDDDFINPKGIILSVDFLEKNADFSVAQGDYISFVLKKDKKGKSQLYWVPSYELQKTITFSNPKARLFSHISKFIRPTFYAVHRTDFMKMIFRENMKYTKNDFFGELLLSMLALIYGKMGYVKILYGMRKNTPGSMTKISKTINDFKEEGSYKKKYLKYKECLAKHLSKKAKIDIEEAEKIIDKGSYLREKDKWFRNPIMNGIRKIRKYLKIPWIIDKKIGDVYRLIVLGKKGICSTRHYTSAPQEYKKDFETIKNYVLKS